MDSEFKDSAASIDSSLVTILGDVSSNKNEISRLSSAQKILSSRQDAFVVRLDGEFGRFNRSMNARGTELKNEIATMLETVVQGTEESIEKIEGLIKNRPNFKTLFTI